MSLSCPLSIPRLCRSPPNDLANSPRIPLECSINYNPTTERLFLAIPLPDLVKDVLIRLRQDRKGFHWTEPDNLHLSLKFIGDCRSEDRERIEAALKAVTIRQFPIQIGGLGVFPRRGRPNVLWAGVERAHPHLFALHKHIDDTLFGLGFEPDRTRYSPHVTIARCRDASQDSVRQFLKQNLEFGAPPFFPDVYVLVRSVLGYGPPRHHILWENALTKA